MKSIIFFQAIYFLRKEKIMNKNLLKILAISAMALAAGACHPNKPSSSSSSSSSSAGPEEVSFGEVLDLDTEGNWALLNQRVVVKGLAVGGAYGNTIIGSGSTGDTVGTLVGFEIQPRVMPTFTETSGALSAYGYGAEIDVEATVTDVNGRVVLADADVTVVSERHYENGSSTGGASISYWPDVTRSGFDSVLGRKMSGVLIEGTYQLASIPTFTAGEASDFYVVFPGEDLDLEDPENLSPIHVQIPAGVADASVQLLQTYFANKKVGDFVLFDALTQYDLIENGGMGLVIETFWSRTVADPEETPAVYSTWADIAKVIQPLYKDTVLDLTTEGAISYTVDTTSFDYVASSFFKPEFASNFTVDADRAIVADFAINVKASAIADSFKALGDKIVEQGASLVAQDPDGILAIYEVKNAAEEVVANILLQNSDTYIDGYYLALGPTETFASWTEAAEFYTGRATAVEQSFNAEATARTTAIVAPTYATPVSVTVNYADELSYGEYYTAYGLIAEYTIAFELPAYTAEQSDDDAFYAYADQLEAAGFAYRALTLFKVDGFFSATTNEFVVLDVNEGVITLDVLVLDAKSATFVKVHSDSLYINYFLSDLAGYNSNYPTSFPTATALAPKFFTTFTVDEAAAVDWYYKCDASNFGSLRVLLFQLQIYYDVKTEAEFNAIAAGLNSVLTGQGYVEATFANFTGYALYDLNTFVSVSTEYIQHGCIVLVVLVGPGVTAPAGE